MRLVERLAPSWANARLHVLSGMFCAALLATLLVVAGCAPSTSSLTTYGPLAVPTPVADGPLANVVRPAVGTQPQRISTAYDASAQQAKITLTIGAAPSVQAAQTIVMTLCFQAQQAVWASDPSLHEVKVIVLGPIRDDYANIIEDAYGVSDVFASTAATLHWAALTPETAWSHYDNTWLRATYLPNWIYGKNN